MVGCDGSWVGQGELENAGYFQWWHQERRREWGGTKAFLSLQAVSGDSVVHALFLLPIQHVIREKVEGGGEEVIKTLANWRRAVWGTCKFVLIIFSYFRRGTSISVQACFRKIKAFTNFLIVCLFVCFVQTFILDNLLKNIQHRKQLSFPDVFQENIQLHLQLSKQKSQHQTWKPIFHH